RLGLHPFRRRQPGGRERSRSAVALVDQAYDGEGLLAADRYRLSVGYAAKRLHQLVVDAVVVRRRRPPPAHLPKVAGPGRRAHPCLPRSVAPTPADRVDPTRAET